MQSRSMETETETLEVGQTAPNFCLQGTTGEICLADLRGTWVVLYFYPRDNTPGCTTEACDFRDVMLEGLPSGGNHGVHILGINTDSIPSHQKFTAKYQLPFPLLSDPDGEVCRRWGVWKEKHLYGRTSWGIERSTFLVDPNGVVAQVWRKVRVPGHVLGVKAALQALRGE